MLRPLPPFPFVCVMCVCVKERKEREEELESRAVIKLQSKFDDPIHPSTHLPSNRVV